MAERERWAAAGVQLSAEQRTRMDALAAKLGINIGRLEAGAQTQAVQLATDCLAGISALLTPGQRTLAGLSGANP